MRKTAILLLLMALPAWAQVYRWVDDRGTVHYSNSPPPDGAGAKLVTIDARHGPASPDTTECYTVRCQGERMEARLARREQALDRAMAERAANARPEPRGLEFRNYVSIQRGMTEGELLTIAGPPDLMSDQGAALAGPMALQTGPRARSTGQAVLALKSYTYLPTVADPFTTTITLVGGRVSDVERVRKF